MFKKPLWQTVCTQIRLLIEAVCSGSMLFTSILDSTVMLGNYFQMHFFLGALRVKESPVYKRLVFDLYITYS